MTMTLRDGLWEGLDAVLVGGGPSLKAFDWSVLKDRPRVIVVNRAHVDVPTADILFSEDERFFRHFKDSVNAFKGIKLFHALAPEFIAPCVEAVPELTIIERKRQDKYWSRTLSDGLSYSSNSMIGALNLADILGAQTIYLLGVDCKIESSVVTNYHSDYPDGWQVNRHQMISFKSDFEHWAAPKLLHRHVVNLNIDSAVDSWPKRDWREVLLSRGGGNGAQGKDGSVLHAGALRRGS